MVISVIADSVAMPRIEPPDVIFFHETWPNLLLNELSNHLGNGVFLSNHSGRARTSCSLLHFQHEAIVCVNPDYVILQLGIVDCAPRIVSLKERYNFNRRIFPAKLREYIINKRKKNRGKITKKTPLRKVYVKPDEYLFNLKSFLKRVQDYNHKIKIIILPIIANYIKVDNNNPGFKANIELYNKLLMDNEIDQINSIDTKVFIETIDRSPSMYCTDGYHLSPNGHVAVADYLLNSIEQKI